MFLKYPKARTKAYQQTYKLRIPLMFMGLNYLGQKIKMGGYALILDFALVIISLIFYKIGAVKEIAESFWDVLVKVIINCSIGLKLSFFISEIIRGMTNCSLEENPCITASLFGAIFGFFIAFAIYFLIGWLIGFFIEKTKNPLKKAEEEIPLLRERDIELEENNVEVYSPKEK